LELPALTLLRDYKGIFKDFFEAVYLIFVRDFVKSKPSYRGKVLRLKSHPFIDGKEYTFYHFTHSGDIEKERLPDLRRMERIAWAKPSIENCDKWNLKVWPQKRNGKNRICIWLELSDQPDYIVILDVRKKYTLPWTAFVLEYEHEKRKKRKEYEEYLKTRTTR
jgi:hypothetical protein